MNYYFIFWKIFKRDGVMYVNTITEAPLSHTPKDVFDSALKDVCEEYGVYDSSTVVAKSFNKI